jgi:hypothetical protein
MKSISLHSPSSWEFKEGLLNGLCIKEPKRIITERFYRNITQTTSVSASSSYHRTKMPIFASPTAERKRGKINEIFEIFEYHYKVKFDEEKSNL